MVQSPGARSVGLPEHWLNSITNGRGVPRDQPLVPGTEKYDAATVELERTGTAQTILLVLYLLALRTASLWFGYNNIQW